MKPAAARRSALDGGGISRPHGRRGWRPAPDAGFSLVEVLVAATILAVAVIGTGHLLVSGQAALEGTGEARGALYAARSKLEQLQGLSPQDADLEGLPAPGRIHLDPGNPITLDDAGTASTDDDLTAYRRWVVVDVDDPADGTSAGAVNYREVTVEVAGDAAFTAGSVWARLRTLIGP